MSTPLRFHSRTARLAAIFAGAALCLVSAVAPAADVTLNEEGVAVSVKGMGGFNLGYPVLQPGDLKPVQKKISGRQADLTYAGDVRVHVEVAEGGRVNLKFSPAKTLKSFTLGTLIGAQFGDDGGTWTIGKGQPQKFPAEKPAKPHLYQGNAGGFTLADAAGHVFSVTGFPDFAYQQITENRGMADIHSGKIIVSCYVADY